MYYAAVLQLDRWLGGAARRMTIDGLHLAPIKRREAPLNVKVVCRAGPAANWCCGGILTQILRKVHIQADGAEG